MFLEDGDVELTQALQPAFPPITAEKVPAEHAAWFMEIQSARDK